MKSVRLLLAAVVIVGFVGTGAAVAQVDAADGPASTVSTDLVDDEVTPSTDGPSTQLHCPSWWDYPWCEHAS